jgi:sugar-specific transcriptional regulator TrmB
MSEITDLTAAVKALTSQFQTQTPQARKEADLEDLKRVTQEKQRMLQLERDELILKGKNAEADEKLIEIAEEKIKLFTSLAAAADKTSDEYQDLVKQQKDLIEATRKYQIEIAKVNKEIAAGEAKRGILSNTILKTSGAFNSLTQVIPTSRNELKGFTKDLFTLETSATGVLAVFQKLISNSLDFALSVDKQNAAFKRATGAGNEFQGVISGAGLAYLEYGINAENAGKSAEALFSGFRDFTNLNEDQQENLVKTTAILEKFGVSSQTTSKILDQATKSLYMNTQEAETLTREAEALARSIGKPISEVASDLASAGPKLAFYGKQMFDVFAQLERQSKATGLSVDSLLGLVGEKFDTFEGAGQAVGRLNAILGGPYLNSIDMLNATEAERLEMIKQAIDANGVQFDQLNKFEQKAFANALGTDVDTLRRSLNELDPEVQLQAMSQEELAKRAGDARDVMSKFTDAINSLVIAADPLITNLSKALNLFAEMIGKIKNNKIVMFALVGVVGALGLVLKRAVANRVGIDALAASIQNLAIANAELAASQAAVNATSRGGPAGGAAGAASTGASLASNAAEAAFFSRGGGQAAGAAASGAGAAASGAGAAGMAAKLGKGAKFLKFAKGAAPLALLGTALGLFSDLGSGMGKGEAIARAALTGGLGFLGGVAGTAVGGPVGTFLGASAGGMAGEALGDKIFGKQKVEDATIKIVEFNKKDTFERVGDAVVAAKPDGTLDKAIRDSNKEVVDAISALAAALDVKVYLGDEELGTAVSKGMNSFAGRQAISAYYQG